MSKYKRSQKARELQKSPLQREWLKDYGNNRYCTRCGRKMKPSKDVYLYVCPGNHGIIPGVFVPATTNDIARNHAIK